MKGPPLWASGLGSAQDFGVACPLSRRLWVVVSCTSYTAAPVGQRDERFSAWKEGGRMSSSILWSVASWVFVRTSMEAGPLGATPVSWAVGPGQLFSRRSSSLPMPITRCLYVLDCVWQRECQIVDALAPPQSLVMTSTNIRALTPDPLSWRWMVPARLFLTFDGCFLRCASVVLAVRATRRIRPAVPCRVHDHTLLPVHTGTVGGAARTKWYLGYTLSALVHLVDRLSSSQGFRNRTVYLTRVVIVYGTSASLKFSSNQTITSRILNVQRGRPALTKTSRTLGDYLQH